jgi:ribosomal protein S10
MKSVIALRAKDKLTLFLYVNFILNLVKKLKMGHSFRLYGVPKKKKKLSILKSPHVHKKAFEQFEMISYGLNIEINSIKRNTNLFKFIAINKPMNIAIKYKYL